MMNEAHVNPSLIINALQQEDLRQKAWVEDFVQPESASKTSAPPSDKPCPTPASTSVPSARKREIPLKDATRPLPSCLSTTRPPLMVLAPATAVLIAAGVTGGNLLQKPVRLPWSN
jgi:hypothetical protein